jgi:anti-anti-sigma factor
MTLDGIASTSVTVTLTGEYDLARAEEMRDAFLIPLNGAVYLIADMAAVTFIDSTALRTLVREHTLMAERGVAVQVTNPGPAVCRVFDITGTAEMFGLV